MDPTAIPNQIEAAVRLANAPNVDLGDERTYHDWLADYPPEDHDAIVDLARALKVASDTPFRSVSETATNALIDTVMELVERRKRGEAVRLYRASANSGEYLVVAPNDPQTTPRSWRPLGASLQ